MTKYKIKTIMGILKNWCDKCRSLGCSCPSTGSHCGVTEGLICKKCEQPSKVEIYYSYTSDESDWPGQYKWHTETTETVFCTNCIELCDNCIKKIKDRKIDGYWDLCKNCDPSDEKIKYEWNKGYVSVSGLYKWSCEGWYLMGYHQKCTSCNSNFLSCTSDLEISNCSKCDPSDDKIQYRWMDRCQRIEWKFDKYSYVGWKVDKYFHECQICESKFITKYHVKIFNCPKCNPSDDKIQYKWEDCNGWVFDKSVNTCSCCKSKFITKYHVKIFNCPKCNPSDDKIQYKWEDGIGWWVRSRAKHCQKCAFCSQDFLSHKKHIKISNCPKCDPSDDQIRYKWAWSGWNEISRKKYCQKCGDYYYHIDSNNLIYNCEKCDPSDDHNDCHYINNKWEVNRQKVYRVKRHQWISPKENGKFYICPYEKCSKRSKIILNVI